MEEEERGNVDRERKEREKGRSKVKRKRMAASKRHPPTGQQTAHTFTMPTTFPTPDPVQKGTTH